MNIIPYPETIRKANGSVWVRHLGLVECSECGEPFEHWESFNYCPSCGAKMNGFVDEDVTENELQMKRGNNV